MGVLCSNKILFLNTDILIYIILTLKNIFLSLIFFQLFRNVKIILSSQTISKQAVGLISSIGHSFPILYLEKETHPIHGPCLRQYSFQGLHQLLSDMLRDNMVKPDQQSQRCNFEILQSMLQTLHQVPRFS